MDFILPVLLVPLFYKLTPLADAGLAGRIKGLGERLGVRVADVYTINLGSRTRAANAMVMGFGQTKRIALGDTLCAAFTPDEIETVIAHELAHQVHRDVELGLAAQAVLTPQACSLPIASCSGVLVTSASPVAMTSRAAVAGLSVALFSTVTMPLSNALSRWREGLADAFAIQSTGMPRSFASAMTRMANQNLAEIDPPRWLVFLLFTHPPIKERLAMALQAQQGDPS